MSLLSRIREGNVTGSSKDELNMDCPFCEQKGKSPDTNARLYINIKTNYFYCHRCSTYGREVYTVLPELRYYQDEIGRGEFDFMQFFSNAAPTYLDLEEVSEPIQHMDWAFNYLILRGIHPSYIQFYNIRKGKDNYEDRIVIPNFEYGSGKCNYFIARSIRPKDKMKYKNPRVKRGNILFNYYEAYKHETVFLTEGWFTGASYGTNFCSYLGSTINKVQSKKVSEFKSLFYVPDGDVSYEQILKNVSIILENRRTVSLVPVKRIQGFDAENFTKEERQYTFNNSLEIHHKDLYHLREQDLEIYYNKIWKTT